MRMSVIVPVRGDQRLRGCLEGLAHQQGVSRSDFEVLVVDNGPSDSIRRIAEEFSAGYLIASAPGSYAARNRGIEEARGAILVFTDADCVPPPGWLREIRSAFEQNGCRVAVGPSYGLNNSKVARWVQSLDDARWAALAKEREVVYCDTRNFAARREIFETELFDPAFQSAGDLELGHRLSRSGQRVWFVPEMKLGHENPSSLWAVLARGIRRGRGLAALYRRHGPAVRVSGERELRIFGENVKPLLLDLLARPLLRWIGVFIASVSLAGLLAFLSLLDWLPLGEERGRRPFHLFDRVSLLLGRLLASGARA